MGQTPNRPNHQPLWSMAQTPVRQPFVEGCGSMAMVPATRMNERHCWWLWVATSLPCACGADLDPVLHHGCGVTGSPLLWVSCWCSLCPLRRHSPSGPLPPSSTPRPTSSSHRQILGQDCGKLQNQGFYYDQKVPARERSIPAVRETGALPAPSPHPSLEWAL